MLYDDYANPREPVTAARARTRSRSGLNGRPQDEGIVGDPGARVSREVHLAAARPPLRALLPLVTDGFLDRFGKKGDRRAYGEGEGADAVKQAFSRNVGNR